MNNFWQGFHKQANEAEEVGKAALKQHKKEHKALEKKALNLKFLKKFKKKKSGDGNADPYTGKTANLKSFLKSLNPLRRKKLEDITFDRRLDKLYTKKASTAESRDAAIANPVKNTSGLHIPKRTLNPTEFAASGTIKAT